MPRRRHRRGHSISLLTLAGVLGGLGAGVQKATDNFTTYGPNGVYILNGLSEAILGYDVINKKSSVDTALKFYGFTVLGYVAHRLLNWVGVNRYMPRKVKL
jgi:hypothetical protein